ncbi:MAG: hypothetical protein IT162_16900 [Bryobacterales bacterium]|nr:hypothetical protein [Bryobacterales bacterium]
MPTTAEYASAKKAMSKRYLAKAAPLTLTTFAAAASTTQPTENVVGIGVGTKFVDGKETPTQCIRFYVAAKIHKDNLTAKAQLPAAIDGIPTDVIVTGRFHLLTTADDNKLKRRPIRPGTSVGFQFPPPKDDTIMAGTFGAVVNKGGKQFILSNNHVLAENGVIALGAAIFQPGLLDSGSLQTDQVAKLARFIEVKGTGLNKVDCAMAEILPGIAVNPRHMPSVGKLNSTTPIAAASGMLVMKTGRTTGHTRGKVFDTAADVNVEFNDKHGKKIVGTFADQILIVGTPSPGGFSAGGDSGSLIVDRTSKRATGLLFAGSDTHTVANHLADVLAALGVTLETAWRPL